MSDLPIPVPPPRLPPRLPPGVFVPRPRWPAAVRWPWLPPRPPAVRILCYADFANAYDGSSFDGLKHVVGLLRSQPYFWARFQVDLGSRVNDLSADAALRSRTLDSLDLNQWDQIWLFGFSSGPGALSANEVSALRAFQDANQGGVLITGDHAALGAAIGRQVPRAGKMRAWDPPQGAPSQTGTDRHSTLREGADAGFQSIDQSDDVPQIIRPRLYPALFSVSIFQGRPHPVLCGPDGVITRLPDHMHEGLVLAPSTGLDPAEWPPGPDGIPLAPEVIAWARVVEPGLADSGREFAVLGAYDGHLAGVGRVVADATWHHWFDINLIGDGGAVAGDAAGFDNTPAGQDALRQIEAYFLNVAVWLARPATQQRMRNRLMWGVLWRDPLFMTSPLLPLIVLGGTGLSALGKYAPRCTAIRFVLEAIDAKATLRLSEALQAGRVGPLPIEEAVMGAALRPLLRLAEERGGPPSEPPSEDEVDALVGKAFDAAAPSGLRELMSDEEARCRAFRETVANLL